MINISIWNPKGGVGKTTIALNIAAALTCSGKSVIYADLDPQGTASMLAEDNHLPFEVRAEIPKSGASFLILDHPPGYGELPDSPLVVFPMRPSRPDMQAGLKAMRALQHSAQVITVFNDCDFRRAVDRATYNQARKTLGFEDIRIVKNRAVYRVAMNKGRTIFDEALNSAHAIKDARMEIKRILAKPKKKD